MAISGEFRGHIWGDIMAASGEFFMAIDTTARFCVAVDYAGKVIIGQA